MRKFVLLLFLVISGNAVLASHLRCGVITAERVSCVGRTYRITVTVFTNTASTVMFGGDGILDFGDGTTTVVPEVANTLRPDLGTNIGMATYTINHTYGGVGTYTISYVEPNRNGGVLNMDNSFFTTFYVETQIDLASSCASSLNLLAPPIFQAVTETEFSVSLGATSVDDNLITYELVMPFRDRNLSVVNYQQPENLAVNYLTGLVTWDTKFRGVYQPGEYNFAVNAIQHIKVDEVYQRRGFVRIDFQVILNDEGVSPVSIHDNQELDDYSQILVPENEEKKIKVFFEADQSTSPSLEALSELTNNEDVFSFTTYDSTHEGTDIKVGVLTIKPDASVLRDNPYLITVRGRAGSLGSDINYLIYTNEIPELPEIITATEKEIVDVQIFPNPIQDFLTIEINKPGPAEIILFDLQGKRIQQNNFEGTTVLELSKLPNGFYICEVRRNNLVVRKTKVIKH